LQQVPIAAPVLRWGLLWLLRNAHSNNALEVVDSCKKFELGPC
jgi:hypothetical protein